MAKANQRIYKQGQSPTSKVQQIKQDRDNALLNPINRVGIHGNKHVGVK